VSLSSLLRRVVGAALLALTAATPAQAQPIAYTLAGIGSAGSLVDFPVIATLFGDASSVSAINTPQGSFVAQTSLSGTISLGGLGDFALTDGAVRNIVSLGDGSILTAFSLRFTASFAGGVFDVFLENPALATYDLRTALGPVGGQVSNSPAAFVMIRDASFSASDGAVLPPPGPGTTVPEPATLALLATGIGALALGRASRGRRWPEGDSR
jgi:hypothetical protein